MPVLYKRETWYGTLEERDQMAKNFHHDVAQSSYTYREIAELLKITGYAVTNWANLFRGMEKEAYGTYRLMALSTAFALQKKTNGAFLVKRLRPDFVREFQAVINDLKI